ncbi:hypothetical protein B9T23_13850 [Acinetobacter terrae]|uniref:hypothetical protein n=1 Tax=Acinetobacter terrae TaxID=2731247 RepID=UPI000A34FC4B|nr:hypothetical protein [Acinetobacter terrae]OTG73429.1 hypothetical protein B9T23_13850 [Acinetobacter terrae]
MKQLLIITTLSLISSLSFAAKPIVLQPGEPLPLDAKIANAQQNPYESHNTNTLNNLSLAAGYAGSKIGSNEFGGDERFNGFFLNASTSIDPKANIFAEYAYQEASDMDFSELSIGLQYKILEDNQTYASLGFGVGYAWLDESAEGVSLELKYVTLPVNFELGYKINPNVDVFGNVGYKWFFNRDAEACIGNTCASGSSSDLDIDGVTYKAGLRYNF